MSWKTRALWLLPLLLFTGLVVLMAQNLGKPQQAVIRSHLVGKPAPEMALEGVAGAAGLSNADLRSGKPVLVNLFASWCLPCAVEAPQLKADVEGFLAKHGNPFTRIGQDKGGRMMIGFGASGVPETYVIDGRGLIRYQHLGEIRPEHVAMLIAELEKAT